ncbi:MAG: hypothetical protein L6R35_003611 [Caloplaca aegaea]|nr:MAG: hypothetical protein L6R35_003611 [Caloplaca aegaea]
MPWTPAFETSSQANRGDLPLPFPNTQDVIEFSINCAVAERKKKLTVDVEIPSNLIRKLSSLDMYKTSITLTRDTGAAVRMYSLVDLNIQINYSALPYMENKDPSPLAWVYTVLGIESSCRCSCCAVRAFNDFCWIRIKCGMASCSTKDWCNSLSSGYQRIHWRRHIFVTGLYRCDAPGCTHACKRFADLERHISTSHCLNAKQFPCSFPGCVRGGANGFSRKDKLKSHFENVHRGVGIPPKQPRALAPRD